MQYCKNCLTTNLRPNSAFDSDGVCIACLYSQSEGSGDFHQSLTQLKKLISQVKKNTKRNTEYDCIVGVSGGKDSTRQAQWVRDRLGMNPLLVCCGYPPLQMTNTGAENLSNLISMGFDLEVLTPSPKTSANLSLRSFLEFGNVCKSTEIALFSTVPRYAVAKKIHIIFWGENPALQVGDSSALGSNPFDGNNLRHINTLNEGGIEWLISSSGAQKCAPYLYPDRIDFKKNKINIFYLGPAWDDWSNDSNSFYAALNGLTLRPDDSRVTGDISGASMLDEEFTNINMMIKYYKFGFGRATDTCNERIRGGILTRAEAIKIVNEYDGICDQSIILRYCNYVGITTDKFWNVVYDFTNQNLFQIIKGERPIPRFRIGVGLID